VLRLCSSSTLTGALGVKVGQAPQVFCPALSRFPSEADALDLEALTERPPPGYILIRRLGEDYEEVILHPIGFSWGLWDCDLGQEPSAEIEIQWSDGISTEVIKVSPGITRPASNQGERLLAGQKHEPQGPLFESGRNPLGTDSDEAVLQNAFETETGNVNLETAKQNFLVVAKRRKYRMKTTIKPYQRIWDTFTKAANLARYSKKDLEGPKGKELILSFLDTKAESSHGQVLAAIRAHWQGGLELPWPINKYDMIRVDQGSNESAPEDWELLKWDEAVQKEPDPYIRLVVKMNLEYGWRPEDQLSEMKLRNLVFDEDGELMGFYADGRTEGFKTSSPVVAIVTSYVRADLETWLKSSRQSQPETAPVFLNRRSRAPNGSPRAPEKVGKPLGCYYDGRLDDADVRGILDEFAAEFGLPRITPRRFRKAVKGMWDRVLPRDGKAIRDVIKARWTGHKVRNAIDGMEATYDKPTAKTVLKEQLAHVPNGLLAVIRPPKVETLEDETEAEAMAMFRDYLQGKSLLSDVSRAMEVLKQRKSAQSQEVVELLKR